MLRKIISLLFLLFVSVSAFSWSVVGHRIVADIAYRFLTEKARNNVDNVFGYHRAMIYTSSWPDEIKSDTIYPESFVWHYQDIEAGKSRNGIEYLYNNKKSEGKHLFAAKDSLINELRKHPDNVDALKFIVHFGGDEFQPMHMGHLADVAGNKLPMNWFGSKTNMHAIWDRWLIDNTCYSSSEFAQYLIDRYEPVAEQYSSMSELDAIMKTYNAATAIYDYYDEINAQRDEQGNLPRSYEYKYAYRFHDTLCEQLYIAGVQLANLLNDLYGK